MKDLSALDTELAEIVGAADRMTSIVAHVQKLQEALEAHECAHEVAVFGTGFDADISIRIQLISIAPRVRDMAAPMPKATEDTFRAVAETILDEVIAEAAAPAAPPAVEAGAIFDATDGTWIPPEAAFDPDPVSEFGSADAGLAEAEAKPPAEAAGGVDAAPPAAATVAANLDSNRWTPDEDAAIRAGVAKGLTDRQISETLPHRTIKAIMLRRQKLRDQKAQPAPPPPPPPPPPPVIRPAEPVVVVREAPAFDDNPSRALRDADRRIDWRLEQLGNKGKWADPQNDLILVRDQTKGIKLSMIALNLGIDAQVCKFRFEQLVPNPTIEEQMAVLRALERRVAAFKSKAA